MSINRGNIIAEIGNEYLKKDVESFVRTGATIRVHFRITEGKRTRLHVFEGIVLGVRGSGIHQTVKVRKMVGSIGVERTFLVHSPKVEKIEFVRQGKVRRAKIFYLRGRIGKMSQLKHDRKLSQLHRDA